MLLGEKTKCIYNATVCFLKKNGDIRICIILEENIRNWG